MNKIATDSYPHNSDDTHSETSFVPQNIQTNNPHSSSILSDEYWLFNPQKNVQSSDISEPPIYFWLRAVFDSPDSYFFHSRRSLLSRLEAIVLSSGGVQTYTHRLSGSVPSLNQFTLQCPMEDKDPKQMVSTFVNGPILSSTSGSANNLFCNPNAADCDYSSKIGTFTRPKKPKQSLPPQQSLAMRTKCDSRGSSNSQLSNSLGISQFSKSVAKSGSYDELDTSKSVNTNVQEIARIQEDNLKAQVAALAAAAAGRHGSQHSITSLNRGSPNSSYTHIASAPQSPHSSVTRLPTLCGQSSNEQTHGENFDTELNPQSLLHQSTFDTQLNDQSQLDPSLLHNLTSRTRQNSYTILPQKPAFLSVNCELRDLNSNLINNGSNCLPSQIEPHSHFGFRPARKVPVSNPIKSFSNHNVQFTSHFGNENE